MIDCNLKDESGSFVALNYVARDSDFEQYNKFRCLDPRPIQFIGNLEKKQQQSDTYTIKYLQINVIPCLQASTEHSDCRSLDQTRRYLEEDWHTVLFGVP